jgi:hypothetical protein
MTRFSQEIDSVFDKSGKHESNIAQHFKDIQEKAKEAGTPVVAN